ncbi:MAG TPA: lactate utilization protein [Terriglobia bacterium]|nr:lactate utilization protein [Terriglobia bacterium]
MSSRDEMLGSIRNILRTKEKVLAEAVRRTLPPPLEGVMPEIRPEKLAEQFEAELESLGCNSHRVSSTLELEEKLCTILGHFQAQSAVLSRNPILYQLQIDKMLERRGQRVIRWPESKAEGRGTSSFQDECFEAAAGITGVDFALAETGSLVLTSLTEGSQLTSLAPSVHIALYRRSQLRASLDEVLQDLPVVCDPSKSSPARSVVFISGTSRTADIEQILVRGVHGPRSVHAILVEDSCLAGQ